MAVPEHVLNLECPHGVAHMSCKTKECNDYLSNLEDEAAQERIDFAHETGEYDRL
jgi:hypothetical protein